MVFYPSAIRAKVAASSLPGTTISTTPAQVGDWPPEPGVKATTTSNTAKETPSLGKVPLTGEIDTSIP